MNKMRAFSKTPLRSRIRTATHEAHQGLHVHPLLARLQSPDLTMAELCACAAVSCTAIGVIEAERAHRNIWPELSLADHLGKVRADLDTPCQTMASGEQLALESSAELLGALYVIHGSALGAAILAKAAKAVLPDAPASFFLPPNPKTWQDLCALLETLTDNEVDGCEAGAVKSFAFYRRVANFHLQLLSPPVAPPSRITNVMSPSV